MIDLGKSLYESKNHFFDQVNIGRVIVNPVIKGYPPIFLICTARQGKQPVEFIMGLSFTQMNQLLMNVKSIEQRLTVAEELASSLIPNPKTHEFSLRKFFGKPLKITGLNLKTKIKKFITEPEDENETLYFFEWVED
jgi:hypothetical protein